MAAVRPAAAAGSAPVRSAPRWAPPSADRPARTAGVAAVPVGSPPPHRDGPGGCPGPTGHPAPGSGRRASGRSTGPIHAAAGAGVRSPTTPHRRSRRGTGGRTPPIRPHAAIGAGAAARRLRAGPLVPYRGSSRGATCRDCTGPVHAGAAVGAGGAAARGPTGLPGPSRRKGTRPIRPGAAVGTGGVPAAGGCRCARWRGPRNRRPPGGRRSGPTRRGHCGTCRWGCPSWLRRPWHWQRAAAGGAGVGAGAPDVPAGGRRGLLGENGGERPGHRVGLGVVGRGVGGPRHDGPLVERRRARRRRRPRPAGGTGRRPGRRRFRFAVPVRVRVVRLRGRGRRFGGRRARPRPGRPGAARGLPLDGRHDLDRRGGQTRGGVRTAVPVRVRVLRRHHVVDRGHGPTDACARGTMPSTRRDVDHWLPDLVGPGRGRTRVTVARRRKIQGSVPNHRDRCAGERFPTPALAITEP